jgi:hypothetical protein
MRSCGAAVSALVLRRHREAAITALHGNAWPVGADRWVDRSQHIDRPSEAAVRLAQTLADTEAAAHAQGMADERLRWTHRAGSAAALALHGDPLAGSVGSINPTRDGGDK